MAPGTLDAHKQLKSDLWLDQPDAHDRIDERLAAGRLSEIDAEQLRRFTDEGWLQLSLDLPDGFYREFDESIDALWRERPQDLAAATRLGERLSFRDIGEEHRVAGYRIPDVHSHSAPARQLYLEPRIFHFVDLVFDEDAVAFQSLYFPIGSEQGLHRDPMFVGTRPHSHLVASWIALEDVTEDCGPLLYVPGSHRMPWFEVEEDTIAVGPGEQREAKRLEWVAHHDRMIREMGLQTTAFTCKRGDVFLWHGGLLHGGRAIADDRLTRKSFVVHYSTKANYTSRKARMKALVETEDGPAWRPVAGKTDGFIEESGCHGIDNPLRGIQLQA